MRAGEFTCTVTRALAAFQFLIARKQSAFSEWATRPERAAGFRVGRISWREGLLSTVIVRSGSTRAHLFGSAPSRRCSVGGWIWLLEIARLFTSVRAAGWSLPIQALKPHLRLNSKVEIHLPQCVLVIRLSLPGPAPSLFFRESRMLPHIDRMNRVIGSRQILFGPYGRDLFLHRRLISGAQRVKLFQF